MTGAARRPRPARPVSRRLGALAAFAALLLGAIGCAGDYVARTHGVRQAYQAGEYERALELLEDEKERGRDRLLYLLDRGMILHVAGRHQDSNLALAEAEKLAAQLDHVSVSEQAKVLLSSEREKAYRAEDFELLLVNLLKALNYAQLRQDEPALVEVRRVNERLRKMVAEEKKPYEQLAIARYLGAVLYEDEGGLDDAFIDYLEVRRLAPALTGLAEPLLRLAKTAGRDEEYEALAARFPGVDPTPLGRNEGQLVVVIERGLSPEKVSSGTDDEAQLVAVPEYRARPWARGPVRVRAGEREAIAEPVTSVESVARVHLAERLNRIALKSAASTAMKAGVSAALGKSTKSKEAGWLAFLVLASSNKADLRSWLSLPAEFQVARLRLPAGRHEVSVEVAGNTERHSVEVRPRRVELLVLRRY